MTEVGLVLLFVLPLRFITGDETRCDWGGGAGAGPEKGMSCKRREHYKA